MSFFKLDLVYPFCHCSEKVTLGINGAGFLKAGCHQRVLAVNGMQSQWKIIEWPDTFVVYHPTRKGVRLSNVKQINYLFFAVCTNYISDDALLCSLHGTCSKLVVLESEQLEVLDSTYLVIVPVVKNFFF